MNQVGQGILICLVLAFVTLLLSGHLEFMWDVLDKIQFFMYMRFLNVNTPFNLHQFHLMFKIPTLSNQKHLINLDFTDSLTTKYNQSFGDHRLGSEQTFFIGNAFLLELILVMCALVYLLSKFCKWCCFKSYEEPLRCKFYKALQAIIRFVFWNGSIRILRIGYIMIILYGLLQMSDLRMTLNTSDISYTLSCVLAIALFGLALALPIQIY